MKMRSVRNSFKVLLVALGLVTAFGAPPSNVLPSRPFPATWQAALDAFSSSGQIPGAVIIVKSPEWGVRLGTTGYANVETKVKMKPTQQFRVGSVTKTFTAQVVLQLEQEGKIKLTDLLVKYLDSNPAVMKIPNIQVITIQNLLQMTSGITNYLDNPKINTSPDVTPDRQWKPEELAALLDGMKPDYTPGTTYPDPYCALLQITNCKASETPAEALNDPFPPFPMWYYTNSNYILLGMLIEKVTGHPIEDEIQTRICKKLGLRDTYFARDGKIPQDVMRGYTRLDALRNPKYTDWHDVTEVNPSYAWTAGAVISTPWDLLRYLDGMLKNDELLNKGTKEKWFTFDSADIHWFNIDYGVGGLMQAHRVYGDVRGHGGAYPGFKTLIYRFGDADTDFVLSSNTWDGNLEVAMLDELAVLFKSAVTQPRPTVNSVAPLNGNGAVTLNWQAGRIYGDKYEVYIGTNAANVDASSTKDYGVRKLTTAGLSIRVPNLKPGETYYWRVDTLTGSKRLNGPLWSFRTGAGAGAAKAEALAKTN